MSEAIKKIYETVTNALDINQSILSGCIDIVVAEQPNGTLKSSPFHLRFGKFQALRGRDAVIELYINDAKTDVQMKLGKAGEGYFDLTTFQNKTGSSEAQSYLTDDALSEIDNASMSEDDSSQYHVDKQSLEQVQELLEGTQIRKERTWHWIWGGFPQKNVEKYRLQQEKSQQQVEFKQSQGEEASVFKSFMGILKGKKEPNTQIDQLVKTKQIDVESETLVQISTSNLSPKDQGPNDFQATTNPKEQSRSPQSERDNFENQQPEGIIQQVEKEQESKTIEVIIQETIQTIQQTEVVTQRAEIPKDPMDLMEISICAHLIKENMTEEQKFGLFELHKVAQEVFLRDPAKITKEQNLMFKIGDFLYQREVGYAILLSKMIYGKDLRSEQFIQDKQTGKKSLWNRWFGSKYTNPQQVSVEKDMRSDQKEKAKSQTGKEEQKEEQKEERKEEDLEDFRVRSQLKKSDKSIKNPHMNQRKLSEDLLISDTSSIQSTKRIKRSLKPTSEILRKLNLKFGANKITYKVHTELQGTREMNGNIFLLKSDAKVVISDVDGTITKSDVFGQLMPMMDTDWTHAGVAQLYQSIMKNGYQIIYLTARGIGQSNQTKGFICSMQQGEIQLPIGPVIMSPDRLLPSFKREVIDKKPEVFKIQALKDIKNIFDQDCPMFAGFGNRETDAMAYQTVGIDINRIFIIDTESQIHMINREGVTNYAELNAQCNIHFPPLNSSEDLEKVESTSAQQVIPQFEEKVEVVIEPILQE